MNFDQYSSLANQTINPEADNLINAAFGLIGECGEIVDHIKKIRFQGHEMPHAELVNEAGDVLWYLNLLAHELGVPLSEIAAQNISKLAARYPAGKFDPHASQHRKK